MRWKIFFQAWVFFLKIFLPLSHPICASQNDAEISDLVLQKIVIQCFTMMMGWSLPRTACAFWLFHKDGSPQHTERWVRRTEVGVVRM